MNAATPIGVLGLLLVTSCAEMPADPCASGSTPVRGEPDFDLVSTLQRLGAHVEEVTAGIPSPYHSVPSRLLAVEGETVLEWRYCTGGQLARDLSLYGLGPDPQVPPPIPLRPQDHLFVQARVMVLYSGVNAGLLELLTAAMGGQVTSPS